MTDSYTAHARAPKQLDIIDDTKLRADYGREPYIAPDARCNVSDLSTTKSLANVSDLSTAHMGTIKRIQMMGPALPVMKRIVAQRKELGLSVAKLCSAAGIHHNTYRMVQKLQPSVTGRTLLKLSDAIAKISRGEKPAKQRTLLEALYLQVLTSICERFDVDPQTVLDTDFSSEKSNDPKWQRSSRIRGAVVYVLVEGVGISKSSAGFVAEMSRQAAFKAVRTAELSRDKDEDFDRVMRAMIIRYGNENAG